MVSSETSESEFLVLTRKLKQAHKTVYSLKRVSGDEAGRYPYLVKGVRFRDDDLTVFVKMPGGPLTAGLGDDGIRTYDAGESAAASPSFDPAGAAQGPDHPAAATGSGPLPPEPDPLQANPADPNSRVLNARATDGDPLHLGNKRVQNNSSDVLKARNGSDSGVLQVKEYDPTATNNTP